MRLWQCGDRILNIKLKNGGLKRTSLGWSRSCWMPWPRLYFTTFDGLEHIEWGVDIGTSLCPTLEFNLLPKTLKRLHLSCDDVFLVLRKQNVHMNDLLPMLHTLRLSGSRLCEENLKNFPPNLIELYVDSVKEKIESSTIFCDLPRTIQRLTLRFEIEDESEHGNDLPTELLSLDIYSLSCKFNWLSKLPMSLKSLNMDSISFKAVWDTLPPQLEELKLGDWSPICLARLPQSLKILELREICNINSEVNPISLPKNLTRLSLQEGEMSPSVLQRLPVTLTDLEVDVSTTCPDVLSLLHPQMTTIRLVRAPRSGLSKLNIFPFPTQLQCLRIYYINDDICAVLPPGLQMLDVEEGLITTTGASKLPKSLTSLKTPLNVFDKNESMSYLRHISRLDLTSAYTPLDEPNENWLSSLLPSSSPTLTQDFVYGCTNDIYDNVINYHLTSLAFDGSRWGLSKCSHVQEPFFASLQKFKNLKTLSIQDCHPISSDWLCLIPKNVTDLKVHSLSTFPTANQLSMLPTSLKYLDLDVQDPRSKIRVRKCYWTDEDLQSLPRSLHKFLINTSNFTHLTQRMYDYLPPNLQESSLKYKTVEKIINFIPPMNRLY